MSWRLPPGFQKLQAKVCEKVTVLVNCPQRVMCEVGSVKLTVQWRPQKVRNAGSMCHLLNTGKEVSQETPKEKARGL